MSLAEMLKAYMGTKHDDAASELVRAKADIAEAMERARFGITPEGEALLQSCSVAQEEAEAAPMCGCGNCGGAPRHDSRRYATLVPYDGEANR